MSPTRNTFLAAGALALVSACATSQNDTEPLIIGDTVASDQPGTPPKTLFSDRDDGGVTHNWSNATCPAQLAGLNYKETTVFKDDGSDVACQYEQADGERAMTLYVSRFGDKYTALEHAQGAGQSIQQRWPAAEYDEEASRACNMEIGLISGFVRATEETSEGRDTVIEVGGTPCFIFNLPTGPTAVAVQVVHPWHVKVRLTGINPNDTAERLSKRIGETLAVQQQAISGVGGETALIYQDMREGEDPLPPAPPPDATET